MTTREQIFDVSLMKKLMIDKSTVELGILRVLKGEINRKEDSSKVLSDTLIVNLIRKMIEDISTTNTETANTEIAFLNQFVPKQLTLDETKAIINTYIVENNISDVKGMGKVMNHLKENYGGTYDGTFASSFVKEVLCK